MMTRHLAKLHPVIVCCAKPARKTLLPAEAGVVRRRRDADASSGIANGGVVAMLRVLALVMLFSAALDATAALADARQDCEKLRGDAAIQADIAGEYSRYGVN